MPKTIAIVGAGPGVGLAVAERFGAEGFRVALIARGRDNLDNLVAILAGKGIEAAGFVADVFDRPSLTRALADAAARFGPIGVLEYGPKPTVPVKKPREMDAENEQLHLDLAILGAITCVQAVLPAMLKAKSGALLFTTTASAQYPLAFTASFGVAAGAALNYARILNRDLQADGLYAGIVSIAGLVVETGQEDKPGPAGLPLMTAATVAQAHWTLYTERSAIEAIVGDGAKIKAMSGL